MFSMKATKSEEIFIVDLTVCSKCQINGEDFVKFCGLLRKQNFKNLLPIDVHKISLGNFSSKIEMPKLGLARNLPSSAREISARTHHYYLHSKMIKFSSCKYFKTL